MATDGLPDEIVVNILARLPPKPLIRFRCVSKYWQSMLMDPYFMKLRSRKIIVLFLGKTLQFIDINVPTDDRTYSIFECSSPLEQLGLKQTCAQVIGSFNGLVVMVNVNAFVLYNRFTGEFKKLPSPPAPNHWNCGYGFGYGATPNDLKIVRFKLSSDICDVYDFRRNSWSSFNTEIYDIRLFQYPVGTFVNGYLYWVNTNTSTYNKELIVLSVKDMVLSKRILPCTCNIECLGTINGCLCLLKKITNSSRFELWVMKEHDIESSWMNTHSFMLDSIESFNSRILKIMDDGRILMLNRSEQLIIYDISKSTYKTLKISLGDNYSYSSFQCVEYVETLVSPLEIGRQKEEIKEDKEKNLQMRCFRFTCLLAVSIIIWSFR
ncbi:F-box/kelch-repeat protein At3g06240-like [Rutidosis leptorrhynchoides]|uniref:F-box/kelch-repeat protein At3g06240-like n=1 Tax=Rutidosis leptorrhynchoides TaxID=125765 RepID=UPI003A9A3CD6